MVKTQMQLGKERKISSAVASIYRWVRLLVKYSFLKKMAGKRGWVGLPMVLKFHFIWFLSEI